MSAETKTILIVDDEDSVLTYISTLFEENGYATVSAKDGIEAMEKVKSGRPDLITLDMSMPNKSGVKFYRELRDNPETKNLPVVVVTAITGYGGNPEPWKKFLNTRRQFPPPDAFIAKPFDKQELLDTVKKLLGD